MLETTLPLRRCSHDDFESATLTWDYEDESGSLTVGCTTVPFGIEKLESGSCFYLNLPDEFGVVEDEELDIEVWSGPTGQAWLKRDIILRTIEENAPKKVPVLEDGFYIIPAAHCKLVRGVWEIPKDELKWVAPVPAGILDLRPEGTYGPRKYRIYPNWPLVYLTQGSYRIVP